MIRDIQEEILRLKKEKDVCILAHSYQTCDIIEIADFVGDSFALSKLAKTAPNKTVLMCGVRFMAETCKLLSPEKKVILSSPHAGCPMAEQFEPEDIEKFKAENPGSAVVAYINTTAKLKTKCDVCVTSASALNIVGKLEEKDILFIPDPNLGNYVAKNFPQKNIKVINGGCPIHGAIKVDEVKAVKEEHPDALFLVHPECVPEVVELADYVGSTSGIMKYAKESQHKEFIIGTEISITAQLQMACPDKKFYSLSKDLICPDMKATTLVDVLNCLKGEGGEEIVLDEETIKAAVKPIEKMLELG